MTGCSLDMLRAQVRLGHPSATAALVQAAIRTLHA